MLLTRLDQLLGDRAEPLTALAYEVPVEAKMTFDGPIDSLETLWLVLGELSRGVSEDLQRRGHGARRLDLVCTPEKFGGQQPVHRSVQLSRPSRDRNGLFKLLCCATERLNCGEGFVSIHLKVPVHERVSEEQIHLWEMDSHTEAIERDRLIERLGVRMGEASVVRPMLKESYLPERAWQPVSALGVQIVPTGRRPKGEKRPELADRDAEKRSVACRPLRLLAMPTEVRVMAEPSDDRDGRPCQLVYQGKAHLLIHVLGPERIAGEWWRGHYKTRDYYDAQDESGRRFWLFRVLTQMPLPAPHIRARWFLHGFFE